jgi:8-oxo-dGTP diphosphatase
MKCMIFSIVLLLNRENKVLLLHRSATNSMPGHYGLVGGKVEFGEKPQDAVIREAHEEVGIRLRPEDLVFKNVYYGTTTIGQCNCVVFTYQARSWQGTPENREPEKHASMNWWPLDTLPQPLLRIHQPIIEAYKNNIPYLEEK